MRYERFLGGPIRVEASLVGGIFHCLRTTDSFDPEDEGGLEFWFFREALDQTCQAIRDLGTEALPGSAEILKTEIESLDEPYRSVARLDLSRGGRAPLAELEQLLPGREPDELLRCRAEARALLRPARGRLLSARIHQLWYRDVGLCAVGPDVHPICRRGAWEEFQHAPREGIGRLEEVLRTDPDIPGATTALFSALKQGSPEALESLLERYQPRMEEIVRKLMGPRKSSGDDILQDVNLRLLTTGLSGFVPRGHGIFIHWLRSVFRNAVRARRRSRPHYDPILPEELEEVLLDEDPEESQRRIEQLPRWLDLLEQESPRSAEVLQLLLKGFSYREIGKLLGCSEGAVSQRISRARAQLGRIARDEEQAGDS